MDIGVEMYGWARDLFPICRSVAGPGIRKSLDYIKRILPDLEIKSISSGTRVYDWIVPEEWVINSAFIKDEYGNEILNFADSNLHVVSHSIPVDKWVEHAELNEHLHSLPGMPLSIPYVTSYYEDNWGFCMTHEDRLKLNPSTKYHIKIESRKSPGFLNYGEIIIPGERQEEIFFSTYICHPSMANNELSGPVVATALIRWIKTISNRRYTYRFVFIPETIGSVSYLSINPDLKNKVKAAFNLTCVGDNRTFSFMPSRLGNSLADKVAIYNFNSKKIDYKKYNFLDRGSDERQYCWPGIDLPMVSVMRSKYGEYPEYHTSDDNLGLISPEGLFGSYNIHQDCIKTLEANECYLCTTFCEPMLGKRNLYPNVGTLKPKLFSKMLLDFMVYCDGETDLLEIATIINRPIDQIINVRDILLSEGLISRVERSQP